DAGPREIPRFRPVATPSRRHARCSNPRTPTVDTIPRRPAAAATLRFPNEVTQTGYGVGLSSAVAAAVPNVVGAVIAEIGRRPFGWHQGSKPESVDGWSLVIGV